MTIQEMFNLLRDYRDAADKVNNRADATLTPELRELIIEEKHIAEKVACYLPMFTPMSCRHCIHYRNCNRSRPFNVCDEYDVED